MYRKHILEWQVSRRVGHENTAFALTDVKLTAEGESGWVYHASAITTAKWRTGTLSVSITFPEVSDDHKTAAVYQELERRLAPILSPNGLLDIAGSEPLGSSATSISFWISFSFVKGENLSDTATKLFVESLRALGVTNWSDVPIPRADFKDRREVADEEKLLDLAKRLARHYPNSRPNGQGVK